LEVSKLAGFAVLGQDPYDVDTVQIKDIPVEMTVMVGGRVYRREH
jgi:predicted amidohydrolase YtcJ